MVAHSTTIRAIPILGAGHNTACLDFYPLGFERCRPGRDSQRVGQVFPGDRLFRRSATVFRGMGHGCCGLVSNRWRQGNRPWRPALAWGCAFQRRQRRHDGDEDRLVESLHGRRACCRGWHCFIFLWFYGRLFGAYPGRILHSDKRQCLISRFRGLNLDARVRPRDDPVLRRGWGKAVCAHPPGWGDFAIGIGVVRRIR